MKRREPLAIDLTPLVDVVFILLIFFIVTSVFKKEELALILDLPSSNAKEMKVDKKEIIIELDKSQLALNGQKTDFITLDKLLKNKAQDKNKPVLIRIDKAVAYERVVKILDLLQKHQLNNLALITKE